MTAQDNNEAASKLAREYKVYLHGEFVALAQAMTKGEAVTQIANKHYDRNESGLMAV